MRTLPRIERPLVVPHDVRGITDSVKMRAEKMAKVRVLAKEMHIVRPVNGESPAGALLEAIADGLVKLIRCDDPEQLEFQIRPAVVRVSGGDGTDGTDTSERRGRLPYKD